MEKEDYSINIIGAGLSGLVAARVLEDHGYQPTIYEAESHVGGRLRTFEVDGYQLDRGFQVMLSQYPKVRQYLDLEALQLQKLKPGAVIYNKRESTRIGDPTRDISALLPTIFSNIGSISDKFKVLKLNLELKKLSIQEIFNKEETTTLQYLRNKGFSEKMISNFFRPFFSGIFLEPDLKTSSRMFEFVYKMFGEGDAVIPKDGINAIPMQLYKRLKTTKVNFNSRIKQVTDDVLTLENGEQVKSHFTIIATEASSMVANLRGQKQEWKSCRCLYFTVEEDVIGNAIIGLQSDKEKLVNNIFYHSTILNNNTSEGKLLSATIVRDVEYNEEELVEKVSEELKFEFGIKTIKFLKQFYIPKALPDLKDIQYELQSTEARLSTQIFLAGDQLLNGSQNAAMLSGERAALGVVEVLEG